VLFLKAINLIFVVSWLLKTVFQYDSCIIDEMSSFSLTNSILPEGLFLT